MYRIILSVYKESKTEVMLGGEESLDAAIDRAEEFAKLFEEMCESEGYCINIWYHFDIVHTLWVRNDEVFRQERAALDKLPETERPKARAGETFRICVQTRAGEWYQAGREKSLEAAKEQADRLADAFRAGGVSDVFRVCVSDFFDVERIKYEVLAE